MNDMVSKGAAVQLHCRRNLGKLKRDLPLHLMILPGLVLLLIYNYIPMVGITMAFQDYHVTQRILGSKFVGLQNFRDIFSYPETVQILLNTVIISVAKIILGLIVPIIFALLLNEVKTKWFSRAVQTFVYLPHFLSWVIMAGILIDLLSPSTGIVNKFLHLFNIGPIYFLGDNNWFQSTLITTDVWKEFGFSTIVYLAALTGIDPSLYEAAQVDGAGRWQQTLHITLPGISMMIALMATLSLGNVLNAGFDQVFNLYSPQVYQTGDVLDTFVYRMGLGQAQYSFATTIGLFKSVISFVLMSVAYWLAYRFADYNVF